MARTHGEAFLDIRRQLLGSYGWSGYEEYAGQYPFKEEEIQNHWYEGQGTILEIMQKSDPSVTEAPKTTVSAVYEGRTGADKYVYQTLPETTGLPGDTSLPGDEGLQSLVYYQKGAEIPAGAMAIVALILSSILFLWR